MGVFTQATSLKLKYYTIIFQCYRMSYPPATRLRFTSLPHIKASGPDTHCATVLSDNYVMCTEGAYKQQLLKLVDWLILAGGKEIVEEFYKGEADHVWNHAQVKAGLVKKTEMNLAQAEAMWTHTEDEYSKHYYT